jgi:hypothetical protein
VLLWLDFRRDKCSFEQHVAEIMEKLFDVATICGYSCRFKLIESGAFY